MPSRRADAMKNLYEGLLCSVIKRPREKIRLREVEDALVSEEFPGKQVPIQGCPPLGLREKRHRHDRAGEYRQRRCHVIVSERLRNRL